VSLDEASVLRSYGSKTFQEFLPLFAKVPFKLVATATPSPNRYKELIHYAGFLGVMDTGLALTRWFQRNSEKAGDLTLYPHKEDEFWMWVHSWAAFLQKPSELGYSDDGYELPPLKLNWHEVPADHSKAEPERDGQGVMFRAVAQLAAGCGEGAARQPARRVAKMMEIIAQDPDSHRVIWHDLEAEREAIEAALPGVVTITGSGMDIDERERRGSPISRRGGPALRHQADPVRLRLQLPVSLPQGDLRRAAGLSATSSTTSSSRCTGCSASGRPSRSRSTSSIPRTSAPAATRCWRSGRWTRDARRMSEIIRKHGLDTLPMRDAMLRSIGVKRVEVRGERFVAINNDTVAECRAWPENSVDQIVTSIPFANQYEYTPSYNDFGHTDDTGHFWGQMDFLTPEWLRILKPGPAGLRPRQGPRAVRRRHRRGRADDLAVPRRGDHALPRPRLRVHAA
jgi:hypothetical protein